MKKLLVVIIIVSGMLGRANVYASALWSAYSPSTCLILDNPLDPVFSVNLGFIPESRLHGYGRSSALEIDGDWMDILSYSDVLSGDIDADLCLRSIFFMDSAGIQLPNQVAQMDFDAGWTWRYVNGAVLQIRIMPGIYSDTENISSDSLFVPFSVSGLRAFAPELAGIVGLEVRPGFEREFMPLIGLDWKPSDIFRLSARLPESRLAVNINKNWTTYLGFAWRNTSFSLSESDSTGRDLMTYEDYRYQSGVTCKTRDDLQFTLELGRVFGRSIQFHDNASGSGDETEIERSLYLRMGIGGPF